MTFYIVEYPFGQFRSFVPTMLPLRFFCVSHWNSMRHTHIKMSLGKTKFSKTQKVNVLSTLFSFWIWNTALYQLLGRNYLSQDQENWLSSNKAVRILCDEMWPKKSLRQALNVTACLRISAELVTPQMPAEGALRMMPIDFLLKGHLLRDV